MPLILILCRHGQAVEGSSDERDHARVLTPHGEAQARSTAAQLQQAGVKPTLALVSDAARTKGTWQQMLAGGMQHGPAAEFHHKIYTGDSRELAALLSHVAAAKHACVAMVGHNPQLSRLATELSGTYVAFATGEAAVLQLAAKTWSEAVSAHGDWELVQLVKPRA